MDTYGTSISRDYYHSRSYPIPHDRRVCLVQYGVDAQKIGWSFAGLNSAADVGKHPRYPRMIERLDQAAEALRLTKIFAPSPVNGGFGVVLNPDTVRWSTIPLHDSGANLLRGLNADGVCDLRAGEGYAVSAAGCYVLALCSSATRRRVFAHVGAHSLFDAARVRAEQPFRKNESTVITAVLWFLLRGENPRNIFASILLGIGAERLRYAPNNPQYGPFNTALHKQLKAVWGYDGGPEGIIDIPDIIRRQLVAYGVPTENIFHDGICAYDHKGLYCHPYDVNPAGENLRNLFLVGISPA